MRLSIPLQITMMAGALYYSLAIFMNVQAQESGMTDPPAQPLYADCTSQGCNIWFSVPGDLDASAGEWKIEANGVPLALTPELVIEQGTMDLNVMYVIDTSYPVRGQPLLDFRQALEDAPAQLAQRGIDPAMLEGMHTSVAFLHLYRDEPVTFWCNEAPGDPCERNAPAWEYTNFRGLSNAVALMISKTEASGIKGDNGVEFNTEFVGPFSKAMEALDEIDGPKIIICFCEGLGPSGAGGAGVVVDEVDNLINVARQKNVRVHVKHAWKAPNTDASQTLERLALQTGGTFVSEETAGIAPLLDALARDMTPYAINIPLTVLNGIQGNVEFDVAFADTVGNLRTVASAVLDVPVAPIVSSTADARTTLVPTPNFISSPGPVDTTQPTPTATATTTPTVTPTVTPPGGCDEDPLSCVTPHLPLLLAASTIVVSLAGFGVLLVGNRRPVPGGRSMTATDTEPTLLIVGTPSASEDTTVRMKNVHLIAEFVLADSPVECTHRLPLYGNTTTWAIGRSQQRLKQSYPDAVPLTISSTHVSRAHALLRLVGNQFMLEALLSSDPENPATPVQVNEKGIKLNTPCILHSGDIVSFSTARYLFQITDAGFTSAPAGQQVAPDESETPDGSRPDPDPTYRATVKQTSTGR